MGKRKINTKIEEINEEEGLIEDGNQIENIMMMTSFNFFNST